ncbi:MAG: hypothetical protein IK127_05955 [Clostridia bacterium]|nr:hypothetical protein [Clostridia bacterium]
MDRFTPIDMETWPRKDLYELYTKAWMNMTFSASMKLRAENLVRFQKAHGQKLVPALLYIISREISKDQAFTLAIQDGVLGSWEKLHPLYPVLNENGTFSFHTTPLDGDFRSFYDAYMREKEETAGKTGAYVSTVPLNNYIISIMPYFAFDSFTFSLKNQKNYYAPILSVGKYDENYLLPIAATVNHAVCDGYHVSELFRRIQEAFDNPEEYLSANENA